MLNKHIEYITNRICDVIIIPAAHATN